MTWSSYHGADGKDYWFDPDTGQMVPKVAPPPAPAQSDLGTGHQNATMGGTPTSPTVLTDVNHQPIAPPASDPMAHTGSSWQHQGPQTGFSFGNLDGTQTVAYDDPSNRAVAWQKMSDYLNPNGQSGNYGRWMSGQMGDQFARFNVSQFQDPTNTGNDWLSYLEKIAPGMRNQFLGLSSNQTGINYGNYESGNWLG